MRKSKNITPDQLIAMQNLNAAMIDLTESELLIFEELAKEVFSYQHNRRPVSQSANSIRKGF